MSVLLQYAKVISKPEFIAGDTVTLFFEITNLPTSPSVTVSGFKIKVPPSGYCAGELSEHVSAIEPQGPTGWTTSTGSPFTFTPPGGSIEIQPDTTITLKLKNVAINNTPGGPVNFTIVEESQNYPHVDRQLTKLPAGFSVSELIANPTTTDHYPGSTALSWTGSDNPRYSPRYSLQWAQDVCKVNQDVCKVNKPDLPAIEPGFCVEGLTHDTPFTLTVDYKVDEVLHQLSRQVTVSVPAPPAPSAKISAIPIWFDSEHASTQLTWDVKNAVKAQIAPTVGQLGDLKSSQEVRPTAKTTYLLTAYGLPGYRKGPVTVSTMAQPYSLSDTHVEKMGRLFTLSPDGKRLYTLYDDAIRVFDTDSLTQIDHLSAVANDVYEMVMAPDGSRLYMLAGLDSRVQKIVTLDIASKKKGPSIDLPISIGGYVGLFLSPDGTRIFTIPFPNYHFQIVVVGEAKMVLGAVTKVSGGNLVFSPDKQWGYSTFMGVITRLGSADMKPVVSNRIFPDNGEVLAPMCAGPSGLFIYIARDKEIVRLNALDLQVIDRKKIPACYAVLDVVVTPDWLFAHSQNQGVFVLDATSLEILETFPLPPKAALGYMSELVLAQEGHSVYWHYQQRHGDRGLLAGFLASLKFPG